MRRKATGDVESSELIRVRTPSVLALTFSFGALAVPLLASAAPAPGGSGSARPSASTASSASARPLASAEQSGTLPSGHPAITDDDEEEGEALPPGHPGAAANPLGVAAPNSSTPDPKIPPGTIVVEVRDGQGKPVAKQDVILGIVVQSIAQGESRKRLSLPTDDNGDVTFDKLDRATNNAYRLSVVKDGATYGAPPFQLGIPVGMRVKITVYPVVTDVRSTSVAVQGVMYIEMRDEVLQLEQGYRIYNVGQSSWLPDATEVSMPTGWKAFNAQKSMDGIDWDASANAAKLRGTIAPGLHETAFRYQIPSSETEDMTIDIGLLPNVQAYRVIAEAVKGMTLEVDGFPPPQTAESGQGTKVLVTEKSTEKLDTGFRTVHVHLNGLPTRGKGRVVATVLAVIAVLTGLFVSWKFAAQKGASKDELTEAKRRLLLELDGLEKARASGEVGPKTYEQARRELVDAIARILAQM